MTPFEFRPWVRRAGLSILIVAACITALLLFVLGVVEGARFGWAGERFVWVYIGTLWLGGIKVFTGTLRPVAELGEGGIVIRPLHQFRSRVFAWDAITGTEQMIGGDRLIVYFDTPRGMRFVALNLNLVRRRKDFLAMLDERLKLRGFTERTVERSRYLSRSQPGLPER